MFVTMSQVKPILIICARALSAPLVIIAGVYGYRCLRKYIFPDNFGVVENGKIYRSGQLYPLQLEKVISKYGIKTVVRTHIPELSAGDEAKSHAIYDKHNVRVISIIMPGDGRGDFEQYDRAVEILRDPDNLPVLVCCARGTHRTGAIVAGYRVLVRGWPVNDALKEMEKYRFRPTPHRYKGREHPLVPHLREYFRSRAGGSKNGFRHSGSAEAEMVNGQ